MGLGKEWTFIDHISFGKVINTKRKKWNIICTRRDHGGLGNVVPEIKNKCLLSK
jgi:hypothetical protein